MVNCHVAILTIRGRDVRQNESSKFCLIKIQHSLLLQEERLGEYTDHQALAHVVGLVDTVVQFAVLAEANEQGVDSHLRNSHENKAHELNGRIHSPHIKMRIHDTNETTRQTKNKQTAVKLLTQDIVLCFGDA